MHVPYPLNALFWRQSHVVASIRIAFCAPFTSSARPCCSNQVSYLHPVVKKKVYWARVSPLQLLVVGGSRAVMQNRMATCAETSAETVVLKVSLTFSYCGSATILPEALSSHIILEPQRSEWASEHTRTEQQRAHEVNVSWSPTAWAVGMETCNQQVPSYKFWGILVKLAYHHILKVWYK